MLWHLSQFLFNYLFKYLTTNLVPRALIQAIKDLAAGTPEAIQDLPLDSTVTNNEVPAHVS